MLDRNTNLKAVGADIYRDAMARFAGAVNIVTTAGHSGRRGVTVSAAVSVSDNPPTILVCLNRNRAENAFFAENGVMALNTLCEGHVSLARAFAGEGHLPMEARFAMGEWNELSTGSPILKGARMALDCVVRDVQPVATHWVVMAEVVAVAPFHDDAALVYLDRAYRSLE